MLTSTEYDTAYGIGMAMCAKYDATELALEISDFTQFNAYSTLQNDADKQEWRLAFWEGVLDCA